MAPKVAVERKRMSAVVMAGLPKHGESPVVPRTLTEETPRPPRAMALTEEGPMGWTEEPSMNWAEGEPKGRTVGRSTVRMSLR